MAPLPHSVRAAKHVFQSRAATLALHRGRAVHAHSKVAARAKSKPPACRGRGTAGNVRVAVQPAQPRAAPAPRCLPSNP